VSLVHSLIYIPCQQRQIPKYSNPLSRHQEKKDEECMRSVFRDDKLVEFVAEVDRVNVVTLEVGKHYNDKDHAEKQAS